MRATWTTWLLAGALAASLQWHLSRGAAGGGGAAGCSEAGAASECTIDPEALGLDDEQARALEKLCRDDCARASELEAAARAARTSLRTALADPRLSPEVLRGRADDVAEAERRALHAMVDAVAEVRAVLDPEQVSLLLGTCCSKDSGTDGMQSCAPRSN